ncbi:MAG: TlpA disulfide reductase family protein [Candidatus Bathyarchaeia archaeon]
MSRRPEKETRKSDRMHLSKAEKVAIPIILIVAVWVVYSVVQPSVPAPQPTVTSATASSASLAPDFTLPVVGPNSPNGLTGQSISLSSFRGKVVFLEFMVPWCQHCRNMAPVLQDLYTKYQNNPNVVFISVAGAWNGPDGNPATAIDAAKFISTYGTGWTYVYDSSGTVMSVEYGVTSTPTFFIIGKSGVVFTTFQGEQAEATIAAAIDSASNAS